MEKKMRKYFDRVDNRVSSISDYGIWKRERCFSGISGSNAETVVSGNWKEELDMDADMTIIQGKAKRKRSYIGCSYRGIWL